jgi:hypothetical protein
MLKQDLRPDFIGVIDRFAYVAAFAQRYCAVSEHHFQVQSLARPDSASSMDNITQYPKEDG